VHLAGQLPVVDQDLFGADAAQRAGPVGLARRTSLVPY
jgi:hypothetical protein